VTPIRAAYPISSPPLEESRGRRGPARVFVECRALPGAELDEEGHLAHLRWSVPQGALHASGAGADAGAVAIYEFDGDGIIDLPVGCGTLEIVGGKGARFVARIYAASPLPWEGYVPRRRQLAVWANEGPFVVPDHHELIGAANGDTPLFVTSLGVRTQLTTVPERCVAGQVYNLERPGRLFTETQVF